MGKCLEEDGPASQESRQVYLPTGVWNQVHNEGTKCMFQGMAEECFWLECTG